MTIPSAVYSIFLVGGLMDLSKQYRRYNFLSFMKEPSFAIKIKIETPD